MIPPSSRSTMVRQRDYCRRELITCSGQVPTRYGTAYVIFCRCGKQSARDCRPVLGDRPNGSEMRGGREGEEEARREMHHVECRRRAAGVVEGPGGVCSCSAALAAED